MPKKSYFCIIHSNISKSKIYATSQQAKRDTTAGKVPTTQGSAELDIDTATHCKYKKGIMEISLNQQKNSQVPLSCHNEWLTFGKPTH